MAYVEVIFRTDCPISVQIATDYLAKQDDEWVMTGYDRGHRVKVAYWDDVADRVSDITDNSDVVYLVVGGPGQRAYNVGPDRKKQMLDFWRSLAPEKHPFQYLCLGFSTTQEAFAEMLKQAPEWVTSCTY
jgi:hypothetical protein